MSRKCQRGARELSQFRQHLEQFWLQLRTGDNVVAQAESPGLDPTAELVRALGSGAITSLSGDDVSFLREFLLRHGLPTPPA